MPANSLAELLNSGSLGKLTAKSRRLQDLADSIRERLPEEEAAHLVAANTDDEGRLVLVMDASVWPPVSATWPVNWGKIASRSECFREAAAPTDLYAAFTAIQACMFRALHHLPHLEHRQVHGENQAPTTMPSTTMISGSSRLERPSTALSRRSS